MDHDSDPTAQVELFFILLAEGGFFHKLGKVSGKAMANRKPRLTREESLKAKIRKNLAEQEKLSAKVETLKLIEKQLKRRLMEEKRRIKESGGDQS